MKSLSFHGLHFYAKPSYTYTVLVSLQAPSSRNVSEKDSDHVCGLFGRPDKLLQRLVYKAVPGLFQNELQRRKQFYGNPELQNTQRSHGDCRRDLSAMEHYHYSAEDLISMSIEYHDRYVTIRNAFSILFWSPLQNQILRYLLLPSVYKV